jgi:hypothetical protein
MCIVFDLCASTDIRESEDILKGPGEEGQGGSLSFFRQILHAAKASAGRSLTRARVHAHLVVEDTDSIMNAEGLKTPPDYLQRLILRR